MRHIESILVVDGDETVMCVVLLLLQELGFKTLECTSVAEARRILPEARVDLVLSDYLLPDGTAHDVLDAVHKTSPVPLVLVMSDLVTAEEAFILGHSGVAGYFPKPVTKERLKKEIEAASSVMFPVALMAKSCVGNVSVRDLQRDIRDSMTGQAMALAQGNRTRVAQLLRIARQSLPSR